MCVLVQITGLPFKIQTGLEGTGRGDVHVLYVWRSTYMKMCGVRMILNPDCCLEGEEM